MGVAQEEKNGVLLDDELIETGFNDALASLQKSLTSPDSLEKAKKRKRMSADDEPEEDEEPDGDEPEGSETEPEEEEGYKKSIPDIIAEDPEAAAAMEVEPFLYQLAKAVDESVSAIYTALDRKIGGVHSLVKSTAEVVAATAQLQKSTRDMVKSIGDQPVGMSAVTRLQKSSRFETTEGAQEFDNMTILAKSRDWVRDNKMDVVEAGKVEMRINKGLLFKQGDVLDQKVASLLKEAN